MRRLVHNQIVMVDTVVHRGVLLMILMVSVLVVVERFVGAVKIVVLLNVLFFGVEIGMVAELVKFELFHPGGGITVMLSAVGLVFMVGWLVSI